MGHSEVTDRKGKGVAVHAINMLQTQDEIWALSTLPSSGFFWLYHMLEMHICSPHQMDSATWKANLRDPHARNWLTWSSAHEFVSSVPHAWLTLSYGATFFPSIAASLEIEHPFSANSNSISTKKLLRQMNTLHWNIGLLGKALLPFYWVIHISVSFVFKRKETRNRQQSFKKNSSTIPQQKVNALICNGLLINFWQTDILMTDSQGTHLTIYSTKRHMQIYT